jgi:hypothetical protein
MRTHGITLRIAVLLIGAACSTKHKTEITDKAFDDAGRRKEMLESTLRVLDDHPDYVDEMFVLVLRHPRTLDRLLGDTARHLDDPGFAHRTAGHLAEHPRGLREVMIQALDASKGRPDAEHAIVDAVKARTSTAKDMLKDVIKGS